METLLVPPVTVEEFEALPNALLARTELVHGVVRPKDVITGGESMSPGGKHGKVQSLLAHYLTAWALANGAGSVVTEVGFVLSRASGLVLIPDIAFVAASRIGAAGEPEGFWDLAPDLAVEIVSPHESAVEVQEKVQDYLQSGVALVLVVWPRRKVVIAHAPDGDSHTFYSTEILKFPNVLPGFSCPVEALFV